MLFITNYTKNTTLRVKSWVVFPLMKDKRAFKKRFIFAVFLAHLILILGLAFLAGREGMLGERMKSLTVSLVPKEKVPEIPKPKSVEEKKIDISQTVSTPKPAVVEPIATQPNKVESAVITAAPEAVQIADFQFVDGAKNTRSTSDPIELYQLYLQSYLRSQWKMPENKDSVSQVKISINDRGIIQKIEWPITGTPEWKSSVLEVFTHVKSFPKTPPKGFPLTFDIRFDTVEESYEQ